MLPTNLTTNEVKNAAGTEVEFSRLRWLDGTVIFAQVGEVPNREHRLKVAHQEIGSGVTRTRRSQVRVDKTITGANGDSVTISFYQVAVIPVGNLDTLAEVKNVQAELNSFMSTTGAGTTVLFDGTGYGSEAAINGSL